jgi:hypothetical protein
MRNIRWTIPFKNREEQLCTINIYEEGWTGGVTVIADTIPNTIGYAADEPFAWEEDDDDDLLNVVRVKTAYIRIKEREYGSLADLHPQYDKHHYVTFIRGNELMFTGFMNCGSYDNDWKAAPREIEFSCVSPLGLLDRIAFPQPEPISQVGNMDIYPSPSFVTIGSLLNEVIRGIDGGISKVVLPGPTGTPDVSFFQLSIGSTIFTPETSNIFDEQGNISLYEPKNYIDFIEAFCNCYGLIAHDVPGAIVFSKFDYSGTYASIDVEELIAESSPTITPIAGSADLADLEAITDIASDDGEESTIFPIQKLTLNYPDNDFNSEGLPYDRCKKGPVLINSSSWSQYSMADALPLTDALFSTYTQEEPMINAEGNFTSPCVMLGCGFYEGRQREGIYNFVAQGEYFRFKLYHKPALRDSFLGFKVSFKMYWESKTLWCVSSDSPRGYGKLRIMCGSTSLLPEDATLGGENEIEFVYSGIAVHTNEPIEFIFYNTSAVNSLLITDFKIELKESPYLKYTENPRSNKNILTNPNHGQDSKSIDMDIVDHDFENQYKDYFQYLNLHKLTPSESLYVSLPSDRYINYYNPGSRNNYEYLFNVQNRIQFTAKEADQLPDYTYINPYSFFRNGWKWRIIATSFNAKLNQYTFTVHHSTTID